jgi:hypothetical protein
MEIKPVYFPFTFISKRVENAFRVCFSQIKLYMPSKLQISENIEQSGNKFIDICVPVCGEEQRISTILKDYKNWASIHDKTDPCLLKTRLNKIPFFDDTSIANIRSDIQKEISKKNCEQPVDHVLNARIFLHFAQELDVQKDQLEQDFYAINKSQADMFKDLIAEGNEDFSELSGSEDPGTYMATERVQAWARLMLQSCGQIDGLYITSSRAVFDHILNLTPDAEKVSEIRIDRNIIENSREWQAELLEAIHALATEQWTGAKDRFEDWSSTQDAESKLCITLYTVPDTKPKELFAKFISYDFDQVKPQKDEQGFKNTVLGVLRIGPE